MVVAAAAVGVVVGVIADPGTVTAGVVRAAAKAEAKSVARQFRTRRLRQGGGERDWFSEMLPMKTASTGRGFPCSAQLEMWRHSMNRTHSSPLAFIHSKYQSWDVCSRYAL